MMTSAPRPPDPWELVKAGRYAEASAAYARQFAADPSVPNARNRALVCLLQDDPVAALAHYTLATALHEAWGPGTLDDPMIGVCYWWLGQPAHALPAWRAGLGAAYTDAAGGVVPPALLLYAGTRLGDPAVVSEALGLLRRHARRRLRGWPGPIVPFLLDRMDAPTLDRHAAAGGDPAADVLAARQQCQADSWVAVRALRGGDVAAFRDRMARSAARPAARLEVEYHLARWEVRRDFPLPAFADVLEGS